MNEQPIGAWRHLRIRHQGVKTCMKIVLNLQDILILGELLTIICGPNNKVVDIEQLQDTELADYTDQVVAR